MTLTQHYLTRNDCYRAAGKLAPKGVMVHSTATPGVMAKDWLERWDKSYTAGEISRRVCCHAFVDDTGVYQTLPWEMRGWHCGGAANDTHIGFEICEPAGLKYNAGGWALVGYDPARFAVYFGKIWDNAVELCAMLCERCGLDPLADGVIICHSEGAARGLASNHADVEHWFPKHGKSMDDFRRAVARRMEGSEMVLPDEYPQGTLYRVQIGSFRDKQNADALAAKAEAAGFPAAVVPVPPQGDKEPIDYQALFEETKKELLQVTEQLQRRDAEIGGLKIRLGKIVEIARQA